MPGTLPLIGDLGNAHESIQGRDVRSEAFNGTLRRECLSLHWFMNLAGAAADAARLAGQLHPPSSAQQLSGRPPPAEFRAVRAFIPDRSRLQIAEPSPRAS